MNRKKEILVVTGFVLLAWGILGIYHSPVFGVFLTSLSQNIFYLICGLVTLFVSINNFSVARFVGFIFLVLGMLGFLFPIGSFADSYLHLFFSFPYLYVWYSRNITPLEVEIA